MRKNFFVVVLLTLMMAAITASCTSNTMAASSWPGVVVDDELAVISYGYQVLGVDTQSGNQVWAYPQEVDRNSTFYAPVEFLDDLVLVGDYANTLHALKSNNGNLAWTFNGASKRYVASVLSVEDKVYAPNSDHVLYVLDKEGTLEWTFETQGPLWSKPVSDGAYVFLASMDHNIYALNLDYDTMVVESPVWATDLRTAVVSDPLLSDGYLYVGTFAGELFKINASNGSIEWTFANGEEQRSIWTSPVIIDNVLYFATEDGFIYALDIETGEPIWSSPINADMQVVAAGVDMGGKVGFGTAEGDLIILDAEQVKYPTLSREGSIYTPPTFKDGKLYLTVVGGDKLVYALDENGREYWSFSPSE